MPWFSSPDQEQSDQQRLQSDHDHNEQSEDQRTITRIESQKHVLLCSICKSDKIVTDTGSGEIICSNCGVVISDKLEEINRPERRIFSEETDNKTSRTGAPTSIAYHDMGLSTVIAKSHRDAKGQKIATSMFYSMQRLRTFNYTTQSSKNKHLKQAFNELYVLKDKLALSDATIEKTAYIYRKAKQREIIHGRSISTVIAAALYIACRETGTHRTLKDIAKATNMKRKNIFKIFTDLVTEFEYKVPMVDPVKCIAKVANRANLTEKTKRKAIDIMDDATKKEISAGKDPMGFAATVLYVSSLKTKEKISQIDIAQAAGVTEVTIRNRFKDFKSKLQLPN
jgi:transcription initiation factor TFIIB